MLDKYKISVLFIVMVIKLVTTGFVEGFLGIIPGGDQDGPYNDVLKVTVIDVGQGDSILIEYEGLKILVDGGGDYSAAEYLSEKFFMSYCRLDMVFLTHPHADHSAGLNRILSWCDVEKFVYYGIENDSFEQVTMSKILEEKDITVLPMVAGDFMEIGDMTIHVLWPAKEFTEQHHDNVNLYSYVLLLDKGNNEIVLTGDAEKEILDALFRDEFHGGLLLQSEIDGRAEVLKVAHHGSGYSLSSIFYERLAPVYCAISVGDNKYGHPDKELLKYLDSMDCVTKRTDMEGSITFEL